MAAIAEKLRLTAAALGCSGRKELCARFRVANPATHFDLERSHKWLQGRALPRSVQLYDDWAKVLGTRRAGAWIASCTLDAFLGEVCTLFEADAADLLRRAELPPHQPAEAQRPPDVSGGHLCGHYACYSRAWSPYHPDNLIRGALQFLPSQRGQHLLADYTEALFGGTFHFMGEVLLRGRTAHVLLRAQGDIPPLYASLYIPGPPASALCGIIAGAALVGYEPRPSASRIVLVRTPCPAAATNRHLRTEDGSIGEDLRQLGLPSGQAAGIDALLRDFLDGAGDRGRDQVPAALQERLCAELDRFYLRPETQPQGIRPVSAACGA
ncbi:Hypothetical protein HVIM_00799 [Roseomonas mucosa]|uniref:Uncharacterized protein n=1 Tax=Roseomonas mucosa TaxID=207340 RepID=A0A379MZM0_9PROT|nr:MULTISPECIES: hypothetical protein [Roseomonas]MBS5903569.1 hypothetical protein [Acetobacteraceae bacterium]AWV21550.1 Hypothetical protein RADP37_00799 [Roseomonas mucosa]MCG7351838.1 hypothetical protein [Roseomonas mucosa]MCG7356508.1 hypothetical protein [Roseomonas mucosa]MDT8276305.1 hypothetical protein [Roseomonas mucosa]